VNEVTVSDPNVDETAAQQAAVDQIIDQLKTLQQVMDHDQVEIEIMQQETRTILADIMANLQAA
jgi:hypothetical protein